MHPFLCPKQPHLWNKPIFSQNIQPSSSVNVSPPKTRPYRLLTTLSTAMGGCASRPKDLDLNEPAPVPVEAPVVESETATQENNGGEETKTEEPSVDLSEANEAADSKPTEEVAETKAEENPEAVEEAKEVEPGIIKNKADAPLARIS